MKEGSVKEGEDVYVFKDEKYASSIFTTPYIVIVIFQDSIKGISVQGGRTSVL